MAALIPSAPVNLPRTRNLILALMCGLIGARIVLHVALYAAGFQALTADEFGRTVVAEIWSRNPAPILYGPWLPFHAYFFGTLLSVNFDMLWMPRIVAIVFGAASIALMFVLARQLFKSNWIALISVALLAVNPAHIWLSSVPLTEIMQAAFLLAFAALHARWIETARPRHLLLCAACLGIATTIRFEAWLFGLVFSALLAWNVWRMPTRRNMPVAVLALALVWIFPTTWVVGNAAITGDPLFFIESKKQFDFKWYGSGQSYLAYLLTYLHVDPIATVLVVPAFAALVLRRPRMNAAIQHALLVAGSTALYIASQRGYVQPQGNYVRYLAVFLFMAYPLIAWLVVQVTSRLFRHNQARVVALVAALAVVILVQLRSAFAFVNDPAGEGVRIGQRLRALRAAHPSDVPYALIELNHFQYLAMHVGANDMTHLIYDRPLDLQALNSTPTALTRAVLLACDAKYHFGYVVMRDSRLKTMVEDALPVQRLDDIDGYTLYAVSRTTNAAQVAPGTCPLVIGTGY